MIISQMELDQQLPTELPAKIHYVCKSKTKAGNYQAKCSYLYNNREYPGIIFAPDNENWFEELPSGTVIKARCVKQGKHPDYPGDLKGDALRLAQQEDLIIHSGLPELLRRAANMIEQFNNNNQVLQIHQTKEVHQPKPPKLKLKARSQHEWADIVESVLITTPAFHKGFSGIMLNAYIESFFDDFWPGDIEEFQINQQNGTRLRPRWKLTITRVMSILLNSGVIQRIKGTTRHYELTESTRSKITANK